MDEPNLFFSTLAIDELYRLVITLEEVDPEEEDIFRVVGRPSEIASGFVKDLFLTGNSCVSLYISDCSLTIGLRA